MMTILNRKMGTKLSSSLYLAYLLEIYIAGIEGERIYPACFSPEHAASTAHRRSVRLEQLGAVVREDDPVDGRCTDLMLAHSTQQVLEEAIDLLIEQCLSLSSEICASGQSGNLMPIMKMRYDQRVGTLQDISDMTILRGKVIAGGRIALPADIRRSLGLQNGDTVLFEVNGDEVRIRPARSALRRVQERLREFAPKEGLVSEELIAERRAEAARD
ncbi:AbrB/MazE/SpoVT family DNA-binding domain-containing protein [Sphingobium sp. H39-3-25]|uniref:AbrB/MazE/SpoVT family DNA-binding domain-containing protein n=1 Tax=Sphingobium arseniciresistens TaxID=3030834 RepID=UPI0023B8E74B|nr:AbrB/MazE/SpoVT family DNA-binding domain-containing protein [Sphingobium arseniciresistens]|tara:strand:- start:10814 stop:11461 length:648 start_codon:yes stop_codon:yes gene_type:complete